MTIIVSPSETNPTHHIKLSDGSTSIGLILRSGNRVDPRAITRRPRQNGQYSPFTQSDWGSGRGIKDAASDRSRFADSKRLITRHPGTVILSGQEKYTTGYRQAEAYLPGKVTWKSLLTADRYIAYKFAASGTGNRKAAYLWIRRRGTPTSTLTVELCSDNAGNPGTVLKTVTATTTNITDTVSQLYEFLFSSVQAVTNTTSYWIKIYTSAADSTTNYWQVATDAARTNALTKSSSDGSSWSASTYDLYFRVVDDTTVGGSLFFYYKSQLYMVARNPSSPKLYMNGDRGVATGTHSTTTLQDTTKSWTTNIFAGSVCLIISGANSEFSISYRTVASNTSTTLTFSSPWERTPVSNDSVYVLLGSNVWTEITGHGLTTYPTDVVTAGDVCYFAQGDSIVMRRMREYINNAVWTRDFADEANYAKYLITYRHPTKGLVVCKVNDAATTGFPAFAMAKVEGWGRRLNWPYLINNCEATTGWVAGTNGTVSADNTLFQTGQKSIKLAMSGAPGSPILYYPIAFSATSGNALRFWVRSDVNRDAGVLKVFLSISATAASQIELLSLPALVANEWTQVVLPYDNTKAGLNGVASIGFTTTATANSFWIDGIEILVNGSEVQLGNPGEKTTGLNVYGDPETPWVFRTQSIGSVENGVFNPIPLRELTYAEHPNNGHGNVVSNVYLYFSFLHGLERFYRNNLDDVGPNRDEGFPANRQGYIQEMCSYIGRFFANYNAMTGYSCILESTNGADWHEVFRSDTADKRIRNLFIQVVPGEVADRLWFNEGDDVGWLPLPGNTLKEDTDSSFIFTHEGYLETGWIYGTEQDAVKAYHSVKLFTERLTANRCVEWDYKKDEDSSWTPVATAFSSSPVQEIALNVSAKRIKYRFRLQTNDNTLTPSIKSIFAGATTRPETRWTYSLNTLLEDNSIDLEGEEDSVTTAEIQITQLDTWMKANTILTMSSLFTPFHNKSVMLEPVVVQPLSIITDESSEKLLATLTLVEPTGYTPS